MNINNKSNTELSETTDFELAQKAARGDVAAFEQIYWQHHRRVFSVCMRMTKNVTEAEDVTQQVFLQLFRKIGSFRGESAFSTWLHRMAVNTTLMHFRKNRSIKESGTEDGELPDGIGSRNRKQVESQFVDKIGLTRAVGELPDGYRKVFVLHDIQGFEHREIAKMLGCAEGTSKSQLHKARRKLQKLMSAENRFPLHSLQGEF